MGRMRHGRRLTERAAAHLHGHDRHPPVQGVVGRGQHGGPVLEALDVGGDGADLVLVGEVPGEVGELEVHLVPRRGPVGHGDGDLLALPDVTALVSAVADEGHRLARQIAAQGEEGVEGGVRTEQVDAALGHNPGDPRLEEPALLARLGEAGGEDHHEQGLLLHHVFENGHRVPGPDHGQVDVPLDVVDGVEAGHPVDLVATGIDRVHDPALGLDLLLHRAVQETDPAALGGRGADEGHHPRVEEALEGHVT